MKKNILKDLRDYSLIVFTFLFIHSQLFAHSAVPTPSMVPTIQVDDHLIINRLATKYKTPNRGDIVTFVGEDKPLFDQLWIKRVVALPGEVVDLKDGKVYINDQLLVEDYTQGGTYSLPNGITFPYTVPEDHYFMMGDNRENSLDSRYIGAIPKESIDAIGAVKIFPFTEIGILE